MVDCNCEIANERCNSSSSTSTSLQYDKAALDGSLLAFSARLFPLARRLLSLVCVWVCVGCVAVVVAVFVRCMHILEMLLCLDLRPH